MLKEQDPVDVAGNGDTRLRGAARRSAGRREAARTRLRPARRGRGRASVLLVPYILALAVVALWPGPVDGGLAGPLARVLAALHRRGAPDWVDYGLVEAAANVALFVPLGLLGAVWLGRRWAWSAALWGAAASAGIELVQEMLLPARHGTVQDVLANSLGACLGALLVWAWQSRTHTPPSDRRWRG
ncbi:VanZ like family protein [Arthrobacter saudimassiliensis]|uniref:VanZ like family protein n=1 Tax=Arthrobacter saudimassiliensis TaxID=1461584 RepID=A0A078MRS9_9MICC|nr:VanZ like family protein [Arthrobacter saudimassiliensis]